MVYHASLLRGKGWVTQDYKREMGDEEEIKELTAINCNAGQKIRYELSG